MEDDRRYEDMADAISDGHAVGPDDAADAAAGESLDARVVESLVALSKIRQFHRVPDPGRLGREGERWGSLQLLERLSPGAFGDVYRAWDGELHRAVAVKFLLPEKSAPGVDVRAEGRLLARVRHPNVVRVFGVAEHDGKVGLVMELVEGRTLAEVVRAHGPLPVDEVRRAGAEIADALDAIHAAGVAHGDVKAQNVKREEQGRCVLLDFGAGARLADESAGGVAGTPSYMAPERIDGGAPSPAADVWALGVLLALLATGRLPFEAASREELRRKQREGSARPAVPKALAAAIEQALAPAPDARGTARELAARLRGPAATERRMPRGVAFAALTAAVAAAALLVAREVRMPTAPLVAEAALRRGVEQVTPLRSGDTVAVGDAVHLVLDLERSAHVYVLNRDEQGSAALLFPLPGYALQNPLPAGRALIPGARSGDPAPMAWTIGTAGGREHFLVVAAAKPMADFEAELRRLPPPEQSAAALALDERALAHLSRGVTGVTGLRVPPDAEPEGAAALFARAHALAAESRGALWVEEIVLECAEP